MRIVVDTNVIIGALFEDDGWCEAIFEQDDVEILANQEMLHELSVVFELHMIEYSSSKNPDMDRIKRIRREFKTILEDITIIPHNTRTTFCKSDHTDDIFVDCAIDGDAAIVITNNYMDLFGYESNIRKQFGKTVKFLRPREFIKERA